METKRKKRMVVSKNRTAVFESDLIARLNGLPVSQAASSDQRPCETHVANMQPTDGWCGDWFLNRITERCLQPAIQIAYRRFARTSTLNGENLRLTIDSNMMAHLDGVMDQVRGYGHTRCLRRRTTLVPRGDSRPHFVQVT